jgi:hypothetical protein
VDDVAVQREAADKAAVLIGTLNERLLHLRGEALGLLMRLQRIAERHGGEEHGSCQWCGRAWPCADRRDAEWNSKTAT